MDHYYRQKYLTLRREYFGGGRLLDKLQYKKYKYKYKLTRQGAGAGDAHQKYLTVVSYNIANLEKGSALAGSIDKIVSVLEKCQADIICLQEVGVTSQVNQAEAIAKRLDMAFHFEQACLRRQQPGYIYTRNGIIPNEPIVYGNAILASRRLQMKPEAPIRMSRGSLMKDNGERMAGADEGRVAAVVQVTIQRLSFLCVSTHLGLYNSYDTDNGSSVIPVAKIAKALASSKAPASILAGDLNVTPESPTINYLSEQGWRLLPSTGTHPSNGLKIDYIMPRNANGVSFIPVGEQQVVTDTEAQHASDHLPLVARFRVVT